MTDTVDSLLAATEPLVKQPQSSIDALLVETDPLVGKPPSDSIDSLLSETNSLVSPTNPVPESALKTAGREAATGVVPAAGGLGGALALGTAGAELGAFGGPIGAAAGGVVGAIVGGIAGEKSVNKLQRAVLEAVKGKEWLAEHDAQREANLQAHPAAAGAGQLVGDIPMFLSGGGVARKVGQKLASGGASKLSQAYNVAVEAGKQAKLGQRVIRAIPQEAGSIAAFGGMSGGAVAKNDNATVGDIANEAAKGAVGGAVLGGVGGAMSLMPAAKSLLGKYAVKPVADAAALAISNAVYDHAVNGKDIDAKRIEEETGGSIPAFVLMTAAQGLLHHPGSLAVRNRLDGQLKAYGVADETLKGMDSEDKARALTTIRENVTPERAVELTKQYHPNALSAYHEVHEKTGAFSTPDEKAAYVKSVVERVAPGVNTEVYNNEAELVAAHPEVAANPQYKAGQFRGLYVPAVRDVDGTVTKPSAVLLTLDNMPTPEAAVSTVLHEAGLHDALDRIMSAEDKRKLLNNLGGKAFKQAKALKDRMTDVANQTADNALKGIAGLRDTDPKAYEKQASAIEANRNAELMSITPDLTAEEALAVLRENAGANPSAYQRGVAMVRSKLRQRFPSLRFNDSDIEVLFSDAAKAVKGEGTFERKGTPTVIADEEAKAETPTAAEPVSSTETAKGKPEVVETPATANQPTAAEPAIATKPPEATETQTPAQSDVTARAQTHVEAPVGGVEVAALEAAVQPEAPSKPVGQPTAVGDVAVPEADTKRTLGAQRAPEYSGQRPMPELMTADEYRRSSAVGIRGRYPTKGQAEAERSRMIDLLNEGVSDTAKAIMAKYGITPTEMWEVRKDGNKWEVASTHKQVIAGALQNEKTVSAKAVDSYGMAVPEGYVLEGDRYVFKPDTAATAPTEATTPPVAPQAPQEGPQPKPAKPAAIGDTTKTVGASADPKIATKPPEAPSSAATEPRVTGFGVLRSADDGDRLMLKVDVDGVPFVFYRSAYGTSGKRQGKWYVTFGEGYRGWLIKGTAAQLESGYGEPRLKQVMDWLDTTYNGAQEDIEKRLTAQFGSPRGSRQTFTDAYGKRGRDTGLDRGAIGGGTLIREHINSLLGRLPQHEQLPDAPNPAARKAKIGETPPWKRTQAEWRETGVAEARKASPDQPEQWYAAQADRVHKAEVGRAVQQGKDVPAAVMADYPDIAAKVEASAARKAAKEQAASMASAAQAIERSADTLAKVADKVAVPTAEDASPRISELRSQRKAGERPLEMRTIMASGKAIRERMTDAQKAVDDKRTAAIRAVLQRDGTVQEVIDAYDSFGEEYARVSAPTPPPAPQVSTVDTSAKPPSADAATLKREFARERGLTRESLAAMSDADRKALDGEFAQWWRSRQAGAAKFKRTDLATATPDDLRAEADATEDAARAKQLRELAGWRDKAFGGDFAKSLAKDEDARLTAALEAGDSDTPDIRFKRTDLDEADGEKRYIRAIPSEDPAARALIARYEDVYDSEYTPRRVDGYMADGEADYKADPKRAEFALLANTSMSGKVEEDAPRMAREKVAIDAMARRAVDTLNEGDIQRAGVAAYNWYKHGSDTSLALRLRFDPLKTPEQRRAYLDRAIVAPSDAEAEALRRAQNSDKSMEEQAAIMAPSARRAMQTLAELKRLGLDYRAFSDDELMNPAKMREVLNAISADRSSRGDKVHEWWRNAILSAPTTQIVNAMGNASNATMEALIQRPVQVLLNNFVKSPDAATANSLKAMYKAVVPSLSQANKNFWTALATEHNVTGNEGSKLDSSNVAWRGKFGKNVVRLPQRVMTAVDEWFKTVFMSMLTADYATREFDAKLKSGAKKRGGDAYTEADRDGYMTAAMQDGTNAYNKAWNETLHWSFQQQNGVIGQSFSRLRNDPTFGFLIKFVLPFVKTPANIVSTGLRKSPANLLPVLYKLSTGKYAGSAEANALGVKEGAEQVVALVALASIWGLTQGDPNDPLNRPRLTGSRKTGANSTPGEREAELRDRPPLSIRFGDKWVSYSRLEPFATVLSTMADIMTAANEATSGKGDEIPQTVLSSFKSNFQDKTFLSGVGDIIDIIESGDEGKLTQFFTRIAAGFVPNIAKSAVRSFDPYVRETRNKDKGKSWLKTSAERFAQQAWPSQSIAAPHRYDISGKPLTKEGSPAYQFFVPFRLQDAARMTKVDAMLNKWNDTAQDYEKFTPATPAAPVIKQLGSKAPIPLSDQERGEYQRIAGEIASKRLAGMTFNYDAPTERDIARVRKVYELSREVARRRITPIVLKRWRAESAK